MTQKKTLKPKKETVLRTATLAVALLNSILTMLGKNPLPFSEEESYEIFSMLATTAVAVWSWWKNNSFTEAAIKADEQLAITKKSAAESKKTAA